jgi:hypothetical protein
MGRCPEGITAGLTEGVLLVTPERAPMRFGCHVNLRCRVGIRSSATRTMPLAADAEYRGQTGVGGREVAAILGWSVATFWDGSTTPSYTCYTPEVCIIRV